MWQELRHAVRSLARTRALSLGIVLTWGLAFGVVTTVFGALYAAAARAVPFEASDRLVMLYTTERAEGRLHRLRWSFPGIRVLRDALNAGGPFEALASFTSSGVALSGTGPAERVTAEFVSRDYFRVLRVAPATGRLPAEADDTPGRPAEVLLGHRIWQSRFGGATDVIGRRVRLNGHPLTVVGVMPAGFSGLSGAADIWVPYTMAPVVYFDDYLVSSEHFLNLVARLAPGASLGAAGQAMAVAGPRVAKTTEPEYAGADRRGAIAVPLAEARIDPSAVRARWLLFGAAGFVLILACVNITNLLVTRLAEREREIGVRLALGCGRMRLARSFWAEVLILSALGLGVGLLVAGWSSAAVTALSPPALATPATDYLQLGRFADLHMDATVLLFAVGLMLLSGLFVSALAFRRLSDIDLVSTLRRLGPTTSPRHPRGGLMVVQIALAVALLAGATLMARSVIRLAGVDPGFRPDGVLTFTVSLQSGDVAPDAGPRLVARLLDRVSRVPGVEGATAGQCTPFSARCARLPLVIEGEPPVAESRVPIVGWHRVGPDHFSTLGIPILRGRGFAASDRAGGPPVVVIGETAARRFFPGLDPIGRRIVLPETTPGLVGDTRRTAEIVGVVGDVLYWPLDVPPGADVYQPALQFSYPWTTVMVRVRGDPAAYVGTFRRAVADLDPDLPIYDVRTLESRAADARSDRRFMAALLAACAACGLLLGAAGIYGVTAAWFESRRRELGIRLALGARPAVVVALVLRDSLARAGLGLGLGLAGATAVGRLLRAWLFEVSPADPLSLALVAFGTAALALASAYAPARRAWRVDPVRELAIE
jgi:putative ABC transport system permease protein